MPNLEARDWKQESLAPKVKTNFELSPLTTERSAEEIKAFYDKAGLSVDGADQPKPILTFEECKSFGPIRELMKQKKFEKPTPIQSVSWPIALSGRDMVGNVRTGSGKTLAFLLPSLLHTLSQPPSRSTDGPTVLVLAPTRELAEQTLWHARDFGAPFRLRAALIVGGQSKLIQIDAINRGPQIYAATPGRLIDFMNIGLVSLKRMTYLVIDEADRMLDMGFEEQLRNMMKQLRPDRQTTMWSATWPKEVRALSNDFMTKPIVVSENHQEMAINMDIQHEIRFVNVQEKMDTLSDILSKLDIGPANKVLIFCNTKADCDIVSMVLAKRGIQTSAMHGDMDYSGRQRVFRGFEAHHIHAVVATDVASRGLDFKGIRTIVNYDMPKHIEDYIHRCGRTGRAGEKGLAITFYSPSDVSMASDLIKVLTSSKQNVPAKLYDYQNQRQRVSQMGGRARQPQRGRFQEYGNRGGYGRDQFEDRNEYQR